MNYYEYFVFLVRGDVLSSVRGNAAEERRIQVTMGADPVGADPGPERTLKKNRIRSRKNPVPTKEKKTVPDV